MSLEDRAATEKNEMNHARNIQKNGRQREKSRIGTQGKAEPELTDGGTECS